jgi:hypothetical protein
MSKTIDHLLAHSGLPGPRGNLTLLYSFAQAASPDEVKESLSFLSDDLHNSPEEFVGMCGIVSYCVRNKKDISGTLKKIRNYASHRSWRIREAVAIGIQEIAGDRMDEVISGFGSWMAGNDLEKRAVVAALCEPKLLKVPSTVKRVLGVLAKITDRFNELDGVLSDGQNSLRKALGYGWSVAVVASSGLGKKAFESLVRSKNRHIQWIARENLKKNRLSVMDKKWVKKMSSRTAP